MRFIVRYWSSALPREFRQADGSMHLLDYSVHPPTRLGLHNAMLSCNDRREILEGYGGNYQCDVYVVEGMSTHVLTLEIANKLFRNLPNGEVKWLTIREFLLPPNPEPIQQPIQQTNQQTGERPVVHQEISHEHQMQLFEYTHDADDRPPVRHLNIDA